MPFYLERGCGVELVQSIFIRYWIMLICILHKSPCICKKEDSEGMNLY